MLTLGNKCHTAQAMLYVLFYCYLFKIITCIEVLLLVVFSILDLTVNTYMYSGSLMRRVIYNNI